MNYLVELIRKKTDGSVDSVVQFLLKNGMLSSTSITHAEIYRTYDNLLSQYTLKKEAKANTKAVYDTAIEHKTEPRTVYRVIAEYKSLI